jgi:hypothetical protein
MPNVVHVENSICIDSHWVVWVAAIGLPKILSYGYLPHRVSQ